MVYRAQVFHSPFPSIARTQLCMSPSDHHCGYSDSAQIPLDRSCFQPLNSSQLRSSPHSAFVPLLKPQQLLKGLLLERIWSLPLQRNANLSGSLEHQFIGGLVSGRAPPQPQPERIGNNQTVSNITTIHLPYLPLLPVPLLPTYPFAPSVSTLPPDPLPTAAVYN